MFRLAKANMIRTLEEVVKDVQEYADQQDLLEGEASIDDLSEVKQAIVAKKYFAHARETKLRPRTVTWDSEEKEQKDEPKETPIQSIELTSTSSKYQTEVEVPAKMVECCLGAHVFVITPKLQLLTCSNISCEQTWCTSKKCSKSTRTIDDKHYCSDLCVTMVIFLPHIYLYFLLANSPGN